MTITERYRPIDLFHRLIHSNLTADQKNTFYALKNRIIANTDENLFISEFSLVLRNFGNKRILLTTEEKDYYQLINKCLYKNVSIDHLIRIYLCIQASFLFINVDKWITKLCSSASIIELVSFYKGLPFYNFPEKYLKQAENGVRNNIHSVFEAIAYENTYPGNYFTENNWNQLILKAIFIERPLYPIIGLEKRANPELTRMLCDYAKERWAANRTVTPEIWRCVGAAKNSKALDILEKAYSSKNDIESRAAALAIGITGDTQSKNILATNPILKAQLESGVFSWNSLGFN